MFEEFQSVEISFVPGLRHSTSEESIDSSMLAVRARQVERNRREIAKHEKDTEEWPLKRETVLGIRFH